MIAKKSASNEELRARFMDHDQVHSGSIKLFTDGSKTASGVGCSVIQSDCFYSGRLSDNTSIFSAELTALAKALEVVSQLQGTNFTIYCDSYSALEAIKQFNSRHPIIKQIQEWLHRLRSKFKFVQFCWVPAHVGIPGNEIADREAKLAINNNISFHSIPYTDMIPVIRSFIKKKWQDRWNSDSLVNNRKYRKIRKTVNHWPSCYHKNRKTEVIISRLRIGHTRFTHQFILEGSSAPVCARCGLPMSVEHILVHCPNFDNHRRRYHMRGKQINEILGEEVDIPALTGFLNSIGMYALI